MRTLLNKCAAAALLSFLAISPLRAEPTAAIEAGTNQASQYSEQLAKTKLEMERDLEKARLDNEKDLEKAQLDRDKQMDISKTDAESHRMMVHDLAWNSWVLFVIAIFFFGYLRDKRRHETIRLMIDKGTPITPEILDGLRKKPRLGARTYDPHGHLCWGITEVLVASALMISFQNNRAGQTAGWIVLAVGMANLILWVIERAHSNGGQSK
jgi:hypothetical protein